MIYGSVCSGIEAASTAWGPLGWKAAFLSEIEKFPRAVLAHHYPGTPLHGDFTTIGAVEYGSIDLLVGGTPCQSFSIAGLRGGLADDRGNLALEYLRLADRKKPRWLLWENVPGVLSSNGGRDFGSILGGMVELGYGFAYRVLDAQHFGVPQRRRRVFVVGYLGDWRRSAAVLFERHSMSGHPAPRREAEKAVAALTANGVGTCGADDNQGQAGHLIARCVTAGEGQRYDFETETLIPQVMPTMMSGAGTKAAHGARSGHSKDAYIVPVAHGLDGGDIAHCLRSGASKADKPTSTTYVAAQSVRRLTPEECESLQGFPRGYTDIIFRGKPASDGPRYKAIGNSMAVPVMRWLGQRIQAVENTLNTARSE